MSQDPTTEKKPAYGKIALIICLALVLAYAIFDMNRESSPTTTAVAPPPANTAGGTPERSLTRPQNRLPYQHFESVKLDDTIAFCPFTFDGNSALIVESDADDESESDYQCPDGDDPNLESDEIMIGSDSRVTIFLETSRGPVAQIGDQLVRKGTDVGGGLVVRDIDENQILLEKKHEDDATSTESPMH